MNALITYFTPFNHSPFNYSKKILEGMSLDAKIMCLDVLYEKAAEDVLDEISKNHYDYILLLGEARSRKLISLEERASNLNSAKIPDNAGILKENVRIGGPDYIYTNVDISKLMDSLDKDLVKESSDAGSFVCNDLYYRTLLKTRQLNIPTLFTHIPEIKEEDMPKYQGELLKIINLLNNLYKNI